MKGSNAWYQRMIGMFTIEAKKIHENSSDNDESLKRMIVSFGDIFDSFSDTKSEVSMAKVITDKVFEA